MWVLQIIGTRIYHIFKFPARHIAENAEMHKKAEPQFFKIQNILLYDHICLPTSCLSDIFFIIADNGTKWKRVLDAKRLMIDLYQKSKSKKVSAVTRTDTHFISFSNGYSLQNSATQKGGSVLPPAWFGHIHFPLPIASSPYVFFEPSSLTERNRFRKAASLLGIIRREVCESTCRQ